MELAYYHIDAFSDTPFKGNPAAVFILDSWLKDELMQAIAAEFNLSETVFCVDDGEHYKIRWFTPKTEVPLCGHATLATAHVLHKHLASESDSYTFQSASGELRVYVNENTYTLDFPVNVPKPVATPTNLNEILGCENIVETLVHSNKLLVVLQTEKELKKLEPDFSRFKELAQAGVIVCALANTPDLDFVSRFFAPLAGISEDPVTGSAHTILTPYFAQRLGKTQFKARQLSKRQGELALKLQGDRVFISGKACTVMQGTFFYD